ncbi:hypothetical protein B0J17DRAFT_624551 [Rhizoctonia solani]|nr:hypothetical protein B0J17DRAFT_624551 [Rhizoctonia solani]
MGHPAPKAEALCVDTSNCRTNLIFDAKTLLSIPAHLSYEEASTIPCAAVTAWQAFFEKSPVTKDSTVLVLGSGVSVFGAQLAKAAGARVITTTSSKTKEAKYKALGVDEIVHYRETPEWSEKVKELTGGQGVEQMSSLLAGSKAMCERLDTFMSQHKIKPVIDCVFGWTEVVDALDYQLTGSHFGKIVIKID